MRTAKVLASALLLAACDSPTVPERLLREVYDYRLLTPQPKVFRWPTGSTVRLYVMPDNDAARTAALEAAVAAAIPGWNAAALYGEVRLETTTDVANADVVVLYSATAAPVDVSSCSPGGGFAYTTFCLDQSNPARLAIFPLRTGGGNVKMLLTIRTTNILDAAQVRRLVAHELGHVLGISQHSSRPTDLMFPDPTATSLPSSRDRATLQVLYHTRPDITP